MNEEEIIIRKLKEHGYRITKQRKMLLRIILSDQCSSCKEIYYKAAERDPSIGPATVYRMINTLEEIGVINRGNMYRITREESAEEPASYMIEFDDNTSLKLSAKKWNQIIQSGLEACGYAENREIRNVTAKPVME
ncbi:ferric uptake regulator Fur family protein [Clostridium sp. CAG:632]|nr:ferric uptake regulator Fur family protein [Clostridium sp. CAG:632]